MTNPATALADPASAPVGDSLAASIDAALSDGFRWLRFPAGLEQRFLQDSDRHRHPQHVAMMLVALIAFDLFLVGDYWIIPDIFWFSVKMRLAVVTPVGLLAVLVLRYHPKQWVHELLVTFGCVGTTEAMVVFMVKTSSPSAAHYYMGVMLPIVFLNTVLQVRFWFAVGGSLLMLLMSACGLALSPVLTPEVSQTATLVVAAACVFTLMALYRLEHGERASYLYGMKMAWQGDKLRATQEQLVQQKTLASLGRLVAGVAHEVNTPLGAIRMSASVVQQRVEACQSGLGAGSLRRSDMELLLHDLRQASDVIDEASQRAADLIDHFRHLALDQSSGLARRFEVAGILDLVLQSMAPELQKAGVQMTVSAAPGIELFGEVGRFQQVIVQLVGNALTHAFRGRDRGHIKVGLQGTIDTVRLTVADDGIGMAAAMQQKIFEPFYTTHPGQGSSGLGLYTVYNIVTGLFGGRLSVESEVGKGTRFVIELPLRMTQSS